MPSPCRYNYNSLKDCLRLLRNKRNHFHELPVEVRQRVLGGDSPTLLMPFLLHPNRFPGLLMAAYNVCLHYYADLDGFAGFLGRVTARTHGRAAAAARARAESIAAAAAAVAAAAAASAAAAPTAAAASAMSSAGTASGASASAGVPRAARSSSATAGAVGSGPSSAPSTAPASAAGTPCPPAAAGPPTPVVAATASAASSWLAAPDRPRTVAEVVAARCSALSAAPPDLFLYPCGSPSRAWYHGEDGWCRAGEEVVARAAHLLTGVLAAAEEGEGAAGAAPPAPPPVASSAGRGSLVAAVGVLKETTFKGGAHVHDPRYKSQQCLDWTHGCGAFCPRGLRCDFAHGPVEVRVPIGRQRRR